MKSMTAYSYLDSTVNGIEASFELKSYNARFFDLNITLPAWMGQLEPLLRQYFTGKIARGKVDFYLRIKKLTAAQVITPNIALAQTYRSAIAIIAEALAVQPDIPLSFILKQEGVLQFNQQFDAAQWEKPLVGVLDQLFTAFDQCRHTEGTALCADIQAMIIRLKDLLQTIEYCAQDMEAVFTETLKKKCFEVMGKEAEPQRIMQEIALLLVKYTINEEIIRTKTHIHSLEKELYESETPGRKIDFLCQEINREINTIGSKTQCIEITQAVISAKDALENIREQARNIE